MKQVFFHVGLHKTGTSTIQNSLYSSTELLASYGIKYASSGLYVNEPEVGYRHSLLVYTNAWKNNCYSLLNEVAESNCSKFIISCEAWSRPSAHDKLLFLVSLLQRKGIQCTAIFYFRNWNNFIRSYYREFCLRRNNKLPFECFYNVNSHGAFNYCKIAGSLKSIFGENLIVKRFDDISNIVSDFYISLGVNVKNDEMDSNRTNLGVTAKDAEIKRLANKLSIDKDLPVLKEAISDYYGDSLLMGDNFIEDPFFSKHESELTKNKLKEVLGWNFDDIHKLYITRADRCDKNFDVSLLTPIYHSAMVKLFL
ncbi:hypothetical protein [Cobetia sp. 5-25-4-2]|uniref:hypothetical protein n=1 Tax=Cobetia sp. 5-25-4-2 TaxID=2737459 RepID=UPI0015969571|nr:hypothetical protein [Cobetia sp. 5-25-4-2]